MKLKTVHTYQSVRFNKRDETHFDAAKPSMAGIQMEYDEELHVVRLRMEGTDTVMVFPTNVAWAVEESAPAKSKSIKA